MTVERRTAKRIPVKTPEGFESLLTQRQRNSVIYHRLMSYSELNPKQRHVPLYRVLEMVGVEQEVMHKITIADDNAREKQFYSSERRIMRTTAKLLRGKADY